MTTLNLTTAEQLEILVQKRNSHQISQWTFEQSRRQLLGEPLAGQFNYLRDVILALAISVAVLLGLAFAYPTEAKIFITTAWNMVKPGNQNPLDAYQDFQKISDRVADELFSPLNPLRER